MLKLTLKSIFDRKLRFALTSFAILIGVAFSVASFVLTDSLSKTFDNIASTATEGVDLTVRTKQDFGDETLRPPVPESLVDTVSKTKGVEAAVGGVSYYPVVPFKANREPLKSVGPPLIGVSYNSGAGRLEQLVQREGRAPQGPNEFNLDISTARREHFEVGQTYTVSGPAGSRAFQLVGLVALGDSDANLAGAVLSAFDTPTAQAFFGKGATFNNIAVAVDANADENAVIDALDAALPNDYEVVTNKVIVDEQKDDFSQIVNIFQTILVSFAAIMVVVSAFIINNTFTIVLGQRTRELALLRALGATGKQVTRSVLGEAFIVGFVSTVVGLGAGVALAFGLRGLLNSLGFELPSGPIVVQPRTVIVAVIIGLGVTLLVSLAPARRARRVPPIAALRDDFQMRGPGLRRRLITGSLVTVVGAFLMGLGLFGGLATASLLLCIAAGALLIFVGINLLSPTFAKPIASILGRKPTAVMLLILAAVAALQAVASVFLAVAQFVDGKPGLGVLLIVLAPVGAMLAWTLREAGMAGFDRAGRLGRENAGRNPRRTASTASALMIGLALVSMASVIAASLTKSFMDKLDTAVSADYIVQATAQGGGFTHDVVGAVQALPAVAHAVPFKAANSSMRINGDNKSIVATDLALLDTQLDIKVTKGKVDPANSHAVLVQQKVAEKAGINVGQVIPVTFADGKTDELTVSAVYKDGSMLGNWVVGLDTWQRHFPTLTDDFLVSISAQPGTDMHALRASIDDTTKNFPVKVEDRDEFKASTRTQINSLLAVIQVFLGISLLIAALGIANTLALSIFERTRELGLLRAVGMTRQQMKRMIRFEAIIVAVFGGMLGVVLGMVFGIAGASAIPNDVIDQISVPVGMIVVYLVVAVIIGVIAAYFPARRAGKLNVLTAISQH